MASINQYIKNALKENACNVTFDYQAWIKNTAAGTVEITSYVTEWANPGKMSLYNKHPTDRGDLDFPGQELEVNNESGLFTPGNATGVFPSGTLDFARTAQLQVRLTLRYEGYASQVWDHVGYIAVPTYLSGHRVLLASEHALSQATASRVAAIEENTGWSSDLAQ